ncbi:nickel ABC transporter permease [Metabacillus sediminilitoris]|uniref:Nickel import system permease protein NikB n=1 Tax=Metabacillus sediminilitoris TaxID=2567941 RepID=A0A4S4BRV9_9BACI|nr:nickel ABC transporter permease [Metabacillus sediminilitoris]QGQ45687.1 ABC transporter permease subunit [Metabacillus sediminilitoris]THF77194.1 ABC transporter permease [Metabacillus sediminilitoris]
MIRFCLERIAQLMMVIFFVSTLTFLLLRLAPGDPAYILLTTHDVPASEEALSALRKELGLTEPLWTQYVHWVTDAFTWQWGTSYVSKEPVTEELFRRIPATLELATAGLMVMIFITFILGISTAIYSNGLLDLVGRLMALLGSSIPSFWLGFLFIYFFSVQYGWLPSMGRGTLKHLILPAITLGLGMGTIYARVLRTNMLEMMNQHFIKAAKARGLSNRRILVFQVFKHAFLPVVTMLGTSFAFMLGGSIIVESIFSWPGLGKYIVEAINMRDYPVIQGYVMFTSFLFVSIHIVVDMIYVLLDPRLRVR